MNKITSLVLVVVISFSLFACTNTQSANTTTTQAQVNSQPTGQAVVGNNKYAKTYDGQVTGRTRIENGQILEWAENYPEDKTIKPIRYEEATDSKGNKGHDLYYVVDGKEIDVAINDSTGDRYFYEAGSTRTFAQVGKGGSDSNESILNQVKKNHELNDYVANHRSN